MHDKLGTGTAFRNKNIAAIRVIINEGYIGHQQIQVPHISWPARETARDYRIRYEMTTLSDPPGDAGDGGINRRKLEGNMIAGRSTSLQQAKMAFPDTGCFKREAFSAIGQGVNSSN
jgi:hypothetical protein